jgi:hypothetical protein
MKEINEVAQENSKSKNMNMKVCASSVCETTGLLSKFQIISDNFRMGLQTWFATLQARLLALVTVWLILSDSIRLNGPSGSGIEAAPLAAAATHQRKSSVQAAQSMVSTHIHSRTRSTSY